MWKKKLIDWSSDHAALRETILCEFEKIQANVQILKPIVPKEDRGKPINLKDLYLTIMNKQSTMIFNLASECAPRFEN